LGTGEEYLAEKAHDNCEPKDESTASGFPKMGASSALKGTQNEVKDETTSIELNGSSRDDLERLGKLLAGLGVGFYVIGLLAVNGYLSRLGVSDFALARPRFVYTGALIAVILKSFAEQVDG
jgi:hypothetical protein